MICLVTQLCPTLCIPMDCACQAPLTTGILQARILEWVAMPSSSGSSQSRYQTQVSQVDFLPSKPLGKPKNIGVGGLSFLQGNFMAQKSNRGLLHYQLNNREALFIIVYGKKKKKKSVISINSWR